MSNSTNRGSNNSDSLPMGKIRGCLNIAEDSLDALLQDPIGDINPRIKAQLESIKYAVDTIRSFAPPLCASCYETPVTKNGDYCDTCHAEREEFAAEQHYERINSIHPKAR